MKIRDEQCQQRTKQVRQFSRRAAPQLDYGILLKTGQTALFLHRKNYFLDTRWIAAVK